MISLFIGNLLKLRPSPENVALLNKVILKTLHIKNFKYIVNLLRVIIPIKKKSLEKDSFDYLGYLVVVYTI